MLGSRGGPSAVVDADLGEGDVGRSYVWQEAAAASAACSSRDARGIPKRHDHGRPAGGMHASGPPKTPYKPLIVYPATAG
jgi:hypothetical protein